MATETEKPLWTDSPACRVRPIHCDWCRYVPGRPAEYATPGWVFPDIDNRFTPPPGGICPFGQTFEGARQARAQRVVQRVVDRQIAAQEAIDSLAALGIDVDMEVTEA